MFSFSCCFALFLFLSLLSLSLSLSAHGHFIFFVLGDDFFMEVYASAFEAGFNPPDQPPTPPPSPPLLTDEKTTPLPFSSDRKVDLSCFPDVLKGLVGDFLFSDDRRILFDDCLYCGLALGGVHVFFVGDVYLVGSPFRLGETVSLCVSCLAELELRGGVFSNASFQ